MHTGAATVENSMEGVQKIKNRMTLWSSNGATRYLLKEYKNTNFKGYMHLYVYCSIIYNSQIMEAAQVSTDRWMDKEEEAYMYNGILLSHKNEWNLAIYNDMDGTRESMMLSEISHSEKDK